MQSATWFLFSHAIYTALRWCMPCARDKTNTMLQGKEATIESVCPPSSVRYEYQSNVSSGNTADTRQLLTRHSAKDSHTCGYIVPSQWHPIHTQQGMVYTGWYIVVQPPALQLENSSRYTPKGTFKLNLHTSHNHHPIADRDRDITHLKNSAPTIYTVRRLTNG